MTARGILPHDGTLLTLSCWSVRGPNHPRWLVWSFHTGAAQRETETLALLCRRTVRRLHCSPRGALTNLERATRCSAISIYRHEPGGRPAGDRAAVRLSRRDAGRAGETLSGRSQSVVAQLARNVDALHGKLNARTMRRGCASTISSTALTTR